MLDLFLFIFILLPFIHLLHELGHVTFARLFRVQHTKIVLGAGPKWFQFTFLGTKIQWNTYYMVGGYSTNEQNGTLSPWKQALISLGGPLFNVLAVVCSIPFITASNVNMMTVFIFFNGWIGLTNLIPFKIGHKCSDGWIIVSCIKEEFQNQWKRRRKQQ